MSKKFLVVLIVTLMLGGLRIEGFRSPAFQGFAHLFVGGLFGARLAGKKGWTLWIAVALSVLELVCFLILPR